MTTSTKQFAWKDRDTAAYDLLQLVYHAPPYISHLAANLLQSIRSDQILPQLRELVFDEKQDGWIRIYALRAYAAAPGDRLALEFEPLVYQMLSNEEKRLKMTASQRTHLDYMYRDPLPELDILPDQHPSNRAWFFKAIDTAQPAVQKQVLQRALSSAESDDFRTLLVGRLVNLLDGHPHLIDLEIVDSLTSTISEMVQTWLDRHFDRILQMCLKELDEVTVKFIAQEWPRLADAIKATIEGWDETNTGPKRVITIDTLYRQSPAYLYLMDLYEQAANKNDAAYSKLISIAERWQGNIPMRAVATHMLGKLHDTFDVFTPLAYQLRYGDVDWDINEFEAPIRHEAGEALLQFKTPECWEVMVDSFFIRPRDELSPFQKDWIAYLTDVLSGEDKEYSGYTYGSEERRSWFRALVDVPAEELVNL